MNRLRIRVGLLLAGIVLLSEFIVVSPAWACSCSPPSSIARSLEHFPAVFIGKVVEVREKTPFSKDSEGSLAYQGNPDYELKIKVEKAWKGVTEKTVTMIHDVQFSCSYGMLDLGDRTLFYVGRMKDGKYHGPGPSHCTRNKPADSALVEAMVLDALVVGEEVSGVYQKLPGLIRNDPNPLVRSDAALFLAYETPDPLPTDTLQALLAGMNDSEPSVRGHVARALSQGRFRKHKKILAPVMEEAFDREAALLKKAADPSAHEYALRRIGKSLEIYGNRSVIKKTIPYLIQDLVNESRMIQYDAVQRLKRFGPDAQDAIPALKEAVARDDYFIRSQALEAIKAIQPQGALGDLVQALGHEDCKMVIEAVKGLNEIDSPASRKILSEKGVPRLVERMRGFSCVTFGSYALKDLDVPLAPYVPKFLDHLKSMKGGSMSMNMDRRTYMSLLGDIGPKARAAIFFLKSQFKDNPESRVRLAAMDALEKIEGGTGKTLIPWWISLLSDSDPYVRNRAILNLIEIDRPEGWKALKREAGPRLIQSWKKVYGKHATLEHNTLRLLSDMSPHAEGALAVFTEVLEGDDEILRRYALTGLKKMNRETLLPLLPKLKALLKDIEHNNGQTRGYAIEVLEVIGTPEARAAIREYVRWYVPELFKDLNSRDRSRQHNFWNFNRLYPHVDNLVPLLLEHFEKGDGRIRTLLFNIFRFLGTDAQEAAPRLIALFREEVSADKKDWRVIKEKILQLRDLNPGDDAVAVVRKELLDLLKRPELEARMRWVETLETIGTPEAKAAARDYRDRVLPYFKQVLACSYKKARERGVHLLALLSRGSEAAVQLLITGLKDDSKKVRQSAALALRTLGPEAAPAVPHLVALLEDEYYWLRSGIPKTLKAIGTPEALNALP